MNSDEMWLLYLFSGTFAGVISGGVAALVAMLVLRKTSKHQTDLAKAEAVLQDDRAVAQLKAQRAGLEQQLKEQREGLERQLQEQREAAQREREIAVIADLMASTAELSARYDGGSEVIYELKLRIDAAGARWGIELDKHPMGYEIAQWGYTLGVGAFLAAKEAERDESRVVRDALISGRVELEMSLKQWMNLDADGRKKLTVALGVKRQKIDYLFQENS